MLQFAQPTVTQLIRGTFGFKSPWSIDRPAPMPLKNLCANHSSWSSCEEMFQFCLVVYFSLSPSRKDMTKVDFSRDLGRGRSGKSWGMSPAWLCWSTADLGPDEPNMVLARMPKYSLNWTARPGAMQGWQRCQYCSSLTWRWPRQSWGSFALKTGGHGLLVNVVQCGLDGPNWSGNQILVQECMPDYSLNWTARFRVIQGWQRC